MNYSSFALAVSEGARLPAISAYIHHSRVCLGVCVCVCVCVLESTDCTVSYARAGKNITASYKREIRLST